MEFDMLEYAAEKGCQALHFFIDEKTELRAIVAIHSTLLGPALGGCRLREYPSTDIAVIDAVRLAEGMTYKAAMHDLPLGGGKAVLIKPKIIQDRVAYFKAFGRFVEKLGGAYITAENSGTSPADMDIVAKETGYVMGTTKTQYTHADPSYMTAVGVMHGIMAGVWFKFGHKELKGVRILVQGLGNVGYPLVSMLIEAGAKVVVFDVNTTMVEKCLAEMRHKILSQSLESTISAVSSLDALLVQEAEVFSPCALGGILNDVTIPKMKASIVAGSTNNQLEAMHHGEMLLKRDILYAPDYVINAGGLIYVSSELSHLPESAAIKKVEDIYDRLMHIFETSDRLDKSTQEIANDLVEQKLKKVEEAR